MPETREITVYIIQELTGAGREHALAKLAEWNTDHDWWEYTESDFKRLCALFGLEIEEIQFSGFSSQGDGASFTGSYRHIKGGLAALQDEAPTETDLHDAVRALNTIQRSRGYRLTAAIERISHHYSHSLTVRTTAYDSRGDEHLQEVSDAVGEVMRGLMDWYYRRLESEYEYRTSEAECIEFANANEYRFTADGRIA